MGGGSPVYLHGTRNSFSVMKMLAWEREQKNLVAESSEETSNRPKLSKRKTYFTVHVSIPRKATIPPYHFTSLYSKQLFILLLSCPCLLYQLLCLPEIPYGGWVRLCFAFRKEGRKNKTRIIISTILRKVVREKRKLNLLY
jgi:hypothetical protein